MQTATKLGKGEVLLCGEGRQMGVKADRMGSERAAIALLTLSPLELGAQVHVAQTKQVFLIKKNPHICILKCFMCTDVCNNSSGNSGIKSRLDSVWCYSLWFLFILT